MNLFSLLIDRSLTALEPDDRKEFWREVVFANLRRLRTLLVLSSCGYCALIYLVNIQNTFVLSESENRTVLTMHLVLLAINIVFFLLIVWQFPKKPSEVRRYHQNLMPVIVIAIIICAQFFVWTVITTHGHPIFAFLSILIWSSSLVLPPRIQALIFAVMVAGFWTVMNMVVLPTDNIRFASEARIATLLIAVVLGAVGTLFFRTTVEAFRQRKLVEKERNTVVQLNLETDALNAELLHRQDILEQQATEIEIINTKLQEQNESLKTLNNEKNELMGIVAHDLKNPIGAVRSLADLVQNGYVEQEQVPEITGKIVRTADRMLDLVTNLLDMNRLEDGAMQFCIVELDIVPILQSITEQYQSDANAKNIRLHSTFNTASVLVLADESAAMQVFENIISNAVKYSPHGKNVYIRLTTHHSSLPNNTNQKPATIRLEVQDEGPGISESDMKKLFGKFARLSAQPTGGEHSTGLGLSIVKKMVEAMNGNVWCESETGNGAMFILELPKA
ncbi:MAG: sensor histidine kinase [Candidatus Kapaibacterium sp.]|nr:MAG: sensor histidine kinase [Candidatus Kapabacteria bacterium]